MNRIALFCVTLLVPLLANAVGELRLTDITAGEFRAESLSEVTPLRENLRVAGGTSAVGESYAQISADGQRIVAYSFRTGKQTAVLFDAATARGPKIGRVDGYLVSPDGSRLLIQTQTKRIYRRSFTATYYIYSLQNNKLEPLSEGGPQQAPVFSPDGNVIAFVRNGNIHLVKLLYDNAESQVTTDGKSGEIINGVPDWVYEEEFSTNSSLVFTADSKQVVWIRYDERDVEQYTMQLFKGLQPERTEYAEYPGAYSYKYPVPGSRNSQVRVMSYDIKSHQTRTIDLPLDADGYIPRLLPTDDATKVAIVTLNRHQDHLCIYMANPLSTLCQLAVEDKADKYIREEVLSGIRITSGHILLPSERDGYTHLYLFALNGQQKRQVGTAQIVITDVYGYDEQTGDVYYAAHTTTPTEQQVFVSHSNGKTEQLTQKAGINNAIFSNDYKYFVNTWSDLYTPPVTTLNDNHGRQLAMLIDNKALQQKLSQYDLGSVEMFQLTTSENVTLNGWLVKPRNFNPQKRYPVIMYQYGGPGSQQVLNRWAVGMCGSGAILEQLMAQRGYVVCCVDGRGTGGRGADFEKCTYLRLGELEARDQVETALWLASQPWADKQRIGIWGWSYGGWNTLMAMSEGRPVFRCGIAIAPPTHWRYYDTVYTERYMRTPKENPSGYDQVNPIARVSQLSGSLLICHGLADDNVHYQNTAEYVEALVQADKDFRQLVYTNRNHSIFGGNTRNHLFRQCLNFFDSELK